MKNSIKILITGLFALSAAYGQEKGIKLINVYEKSFNEPIVDVIFDTATVSIKEAKKMGWKDEAFTKEEKSKGKGKILYAKVVIFKETRHGKPTKLIKFFNKDGSLKKVYKTGNYAEVLFSENEKFIGITTPTKWYNGEHESKFTMINTEGKILWELEGLGTGPYVPSPNGKYCIGEESSEFESSPVSIYSKKGLEKVIKKNFSGFWIGFQEKENYFAIGVPMEFPKGKILVLDSNLKVLFQDTTAAIFGDVGGGHYIAFSNTENYIAYPVVKTEGSKGGIGVFNMSGSLLFKVYPQGRGNYKYKFSKDDKNILIYDTFGSCYFVDIRSAKILWQRIVKAKGIGTVSVTPDFNTILVGIYPNKISLLDKEGNILLEDEIKNFLFLHVPKVKISPKGDKFIVSDQRGTINAFYIKRRMP